MTRAAQLYTLSLSAGGVKDLTVEGGMYKIISQTGPVRVSRDGNNIGPMLAGQGERERFVRMSVQDLSGAANTVVILIADQEFIDDRIYGQVEVIDGARAISLASNSFGGYGNSAASVGNFSHVQLWNPGSRTKYIALEQVWMSSTAASAFQLRFNNAALTTLFMAPQNKLINGTASTAECRTDQLAAVAGTALSPFYWQAANAMTPITFKEPIIIPPGQGLLCVNQNANTAIAAAFDFYEFTP